LITIRSCSSPPMSFNRQLIQWLIWYNAERPPWSLEVKSPVQFLLKGNPSLCKTWWPNTDCLTYLIPIAYVAQAVFPTENDREDFIGPRLTIRSGMIICFEHSVLAAASSSAVRRSSRHVTAVKGEFQRPAECCGLFEVRRTQCRRHQEARHLLIDRRPKNISLRLDTVMCRARAARFS
jgi:hypothetical protein